MRRLLIGTVIIATGAGGLLSCSDSRHGAEIETRSAALNSTPVDCTTGAPPTGYPQRVCFFWLS